MSHELRTPLNAIIGYSELIRESAQDADADPEMVADIDRILISSRHLLRMINDVLDLSKIGAGRMVLEHQPFNAAALLSDVVTTATQLAARRTTASKRPSPPTSVRWSATAHASRRFC